MFGKIINSIKSLFSSPTPVEDWDKNIQKINTEIAGCIFDEASVYPVANMNGQTTLTLTLHTPSGETRRPTIRKRIFISGIVASQVTSD